MYSLIINGSLSLPLDDSHYCRLLSPQLRDTGDITAEFYVLISCWLGADGWMATCCERDVTAHSRCWVVQ